MGAACGIHVTDEKFMQKFSGGPEW